MDNKTIYFAKVKPGGVIPTKRDEDGAFDIYACFDEDYMVLQPHETKLVPTGIASAFSRDYVAILKERGSTGSNGIGQRAGVIDSGYRGEWFIPLTNHNSVPLIIMKDNDESESMTIELVLRHGAVKKYRYSKAITQCIMVEVPALSTKEVSYDELMCFASDRGTGALGSSGK